MTRSRSGNNNNNNNDDNEYYHCDSNTNNSNENRSWQKPPRRLRLAWMAPSQLASQEASFGPAELGGMHTYMHKDIQKEVYNICIYIQKFMYVTYACRGYKGYKGYLQE